jgi:hypothetical protein
MSLLNNITKSKISSIIGVLVMLASVVSVFIESLEIDWTQAGIGLAAGFALLFVKDPKSGTMVVLIACSLLLLYSCKPQSMFNSESHTFYKYRDTAFYKGGDSVTQKIDPDAIKAMLLAMQALGEKPQIIYKSDKRINELIYSLNAANELVASCNSKDSLYTAKLKELSKVTNTREIVVKEECPTWLKYLVFALVGGIIVLLIIIFIKR